MRPESFADAQRGTVDASDTATAVSAEVERLEQLVGSRLPPVELIGHRGEAVRLPDDKPTVLFFFSGAWSPESSGYPAGWADIPGVRGCTLECFSYARSYQQFVAAGAQIIGVSSQSPDQLADFVSYADLPYVLASDQDGRAAAALGLPVFQAGGVGWLKRATILVDRLGVVRYVQAPITDPAVAVREMLALVQ